MKFIKKIYAFFYTLFYKQNKYHRYSVLRHTYEVTKNLYRMKKYRLLLAGILHDIGKPFVAHQDENDIKENNGTYSFTGHEEKSYQIVKYWLISKYTKDIIRYHYLITGMAVDQRKFEKTRENKYRESYKKRFAIWSHLPQQMKDDLILFKICDDKGKGYSDIPKAVPKFIEHRFNKLKEKYDR